MRPIAADFMPAGARAQWPIWIAIVLLLIAAGHQTRVAAGLQHEREAIVAKAQAERQLAVVEAPRPPSANPAQYTDDAARLEALASLDNGSVFAALESVGVPGIRVTVIEIRASDRQARIDLAVREAADLLRYVADINAGLPAEARWTLTHAQRDPVGGGGSATLVARLVRQPAHSRP